MTIPRASTVCWKTILPAFLVTIVLTVIPAQPSDFANLQTADKFLKEGNLIEAGRCVSEILKLEPHFPEAIHLLSKIRLKEGTIQSRTKAEEYIREAIRLAPDSLRYHLTLADIYEAQSFREKALGYLEDLNKRFPDNPEILFRIAVMYRAYAERYQFATAPVTFGAADSWDGISENATDMIQNARSASYNTVQFSEYFKSKLADAEKMLIKIKDIEHRYDNLFYELALISYLKGDWEAMVKHAGEHLARNPENRNAYLLSGLAHLRMGEYEEADRQFAQFRERLLPIEKTFFEKLDIFLPEAENTRLAQSDSLTGARFRDKFWISRDPLFLTGYNERVVEHYGRVAEALLFFSSPDYEVEGWKTDRGIIWIRYGAPERRNKRLAFFDIDMSVSARLGAGNTGRWSNDIYESWYYDDFFFNFYEFPLWSGNFRFFDVRNNSSSERARNLLTTKPDLFRLKTKGSRIDFPRYAVSFRGKKDWNRVELFFGIPMKALRHFALGGRSVADADYGVFLFDMEANPVLSHASSIQHEMQNAADTSSNTFITLVNRMEVPSGNYSLAIEFKDDSSGNYGAVRDRIYLKAYGYDSLEVSDILLASNIDIPRAGEIQSINDLDYSANITRIFRKKSPVFLYFEIYNLTLTGAQAKSDFHVEYGVQKKKTDSGDEWSMTGIIGRIFNFSGNEFRLTTSAAYEGSKPVENLYLEIDSASLEEGMYQLTLRVTDKLRGTYSEKNTIFYIAG